LRSLSSALAREGVRSFENFVREINRLQAEQHIKEQERQQEQRRRQQHRKDQWAGAPKPVVGTGPRCCPQAAAGSSSRRP
jgi:hypothetical protein